MRDLDLNELELVYGAGSAGRGCQPPPPSCWCDDDKGSKKSKKSKQSKKSKKSKKSKHSKC